MDGYDVGLSNPFTKSGDPAIRGRIFDIYCLDPRTGTEGHYNFIRLEEDRQCDRRFKATVVTSYKGYSKELGSSTMVMKIYSYIKCVPTIF